MPSVFKVKKYMGTSFYDIFYINKGVFYKWLVVGIFGAIYGLKPGIDLIRSNKK